MFFPKQCVHTEGVLTVTLLRPGVQSGWYRKRPAFTQNASCEMSMCISTAQARTKHWPGISVRHFPCKIPHKLPLVTCPCAFRLHRLAQSVLPGLGVSLPPQHPPPQLYHLLPPQHPHHHLPLTIIIIIIIIIVIIITITTITTTTTIIIIIAIIITTIIIIIVVVIIIIIITIIIIHHHHLLLFLHLHHLHHLLLLLHHHHHHLHHHQHFNTLSFYSTHTVRGLLPG